MRRGVVGVALCVVGCLPEDGAPPAEGVGGASGYPTGSGGTASGGSTPGSFAGAGSGGAGGGSVVSGGSAGAVVGGSAGTTPGAGGQTSSGGSASGGGASGGTAGAPGGGTGGAVAPPSEGTDVPPVKGFLHTQGRKILDSDNHEVRLTGLSWFGMETSNFAPHGLWQRGLGSFLDQMKTLGYNVLRIPFASQMLDPGSTPNGVDQNTNPDLQGLTPLQLLDKIVAGAGSRGLKVILDRHRPDSNAQSELWYTGQYSEARWIDDWKMLAQHYRTNPTVVGVDLHNEPHGTATWGDGNMTTDWKAAAERGGNAVLAENPQLLIFVEGIEKFEGTPGWWGGNLRGARSKPVNLSVNHRLVYSPHEYPASVFAQPWFTDASYPANLPAVWKDSWGYLAESDTTPIWIGEFGTKLETDSDEKWLGALVGYVGTQKLSFAYWCLNPNSGDTGGILKDDWMTVQQAKQDLLSPVLAPLLP